MTQPSNRPMPVSRKRSETSEDGEESTGKKRARGRPRLETRDETAADRRRTQIRLAQRAYRNRKDTAIDSLKRRVKELEQVNEDMGREFMNFSDFVLGQGVSQMSPDVTRRLNDATRKFLALSRKATEESPDDDDSSASDKPSKAPSPQRLAKRTPSESAASIGDTQSTPNTEWSHESVIASGVVQAPADPFQQFDALPHASVNSLTRPSVVDSSFPILDNQSSVSLFRNSFTQSPFDTILPVPQSYAAQEYTFGRRYQRATIEAGLSLALMENPPPDRYMAVFSFCLQFETRQEIIRRLSIILDKTRNESLNNWQFPFTNLGGAGTWLPSPDMKKTSRDAAGHELPIGNHGLPQPYKPSTMTGFQTGPFREEIEATRDMRLDHRMRMLYPGFEGDFFDGDEVEAYLRERGLAIPEGKDYIEAEVELEAFEKPPELPPRNFARNRPDFFKQSSSGGQYVMPTFTQGISATSGNEWTATTTTSVDNFNMNNNQMGLSGFDSTLGTLGSDLPSTNNQQFDQDLAPFVDMSEIPWRLWEAPPASKKTKVTIDVNRLIAELAGKSVCLGRSPGIRPKDVNSAVKLSVILQEN